MPDPVNTAVAPMTTSPPPMPMDAGPANPEAGQPSSLSEQQQPQTTPPPSQPTQQVSVAPSLAPTAPHHGMLGSVYDRVLAGIAGPRMKDVPYIDSDPKSPTYGRTFTRQVDQGPGGQWRSMIAGMLTGLAAGAQAPPQKSALASAAGGLGAGFVAEKDQKIKDSDRQRKQMGEDFEKEQRALLQKHEIAKGNVQMYQNMLAASKLKYDMDPVRQGGTALYKSAVDAGLPAQMISAEDAMRRTQADPHFAADNLILPAGMTEDKLDEASGQVTPGAGQVVVIPGHDGKVKIPPAMADIVKQYAGYSGRADLVSQIQNDQEIPVGQLAALNTAMTEGMKTVLNGEMNPQVFWDENTKHWAIINPVTKSTVSYAQSGLVPLAAKEADSREALRSAQSQADIAKAQTSLLGARLELLQSQFANPPQTPEQKQQAGEQLQQSFGQLPPLSKALLGQLPINTQADVLGVWSGQKDPASLPTTIRKGTGQLSRSQIEDMVLRMDPTWNEGKFKAVQKVNSDFAEGKEGQSIRSFNQFISHAAEAVQIANKGQEMGQTLGIPILDQPLNSLKQNVLAQTYVNQLQPAITAALDEWQTFIKAGHAPTASEVEAQGILANTASTPSQIRTALNVMANQATDRLDAINETYKTVTSRDYPNLITPRAKSLAPVLGIGDRVSQYGSGGFLFTGPSSVTGGAGTQGQAPLSNLHSNGQTTIGWDGKQWVDSNTRKPYQAPAQNQATPQPAAQPVQPEVPTP